MYSGRKGKLLDIPTADVSRTKTETVIVRIYWAWWAAS